jgi:hypothetical protein
MSFDEEDSFSLLTQALASMSPGEEDEIAIATPPPSTIAFSAWTNASVIATKVDETPAPVSATKVNLLETPGPVAATKADMSPTQVAVTKVTPVTAALKTPAQNPPWWTRVTRIRM